MVSVAPGKITSARIVNVELVDELEDELVLADHRGDEQRGGRVLGTEIEMSSLKSFMLQDYASFQEQPQIGYGCGLLLTTYFLHMDGNGDGKRIKAFLKALRDGKEGEGALKVLLDGRTFEKLQEDITKAWSRKGVDFTFGKS